MIVAKIGERDVEFHGLSLSEPLLFALKSVSKDSENEIISYYVELGLKLFRDAISRKKLPQKVNRVTNILYKDTKIISKFEVYTSYLDSEYSISKNIILYMKLSNVNTYIDISGSKIESMMVESGLDLNNSQVVNIEAPREKKYRCMNKEENL